MITVKDRKRTRHFKDYDEYAAYVEANWSCDFCDPYRENGCHKTRMCSTLAAYEDLKSRGRTAAVCRSMVRPRETSLQDRIVALVELSRQPHELEEYDTS